MQEKYYLGLDIGTDSVGYAVTNQSYDLCKFKGEPMWGVTLFEEGNLCSERRAFRSARRRLDRVQQRLQLLQELFAPEILKIDKHFFIRLKKSRLCRADAEETYSLFSSNGYTDVMYHRDYPTIHHLICELMNSSKSHDVRLVYIACAWLVKHRGHFLSDVSKENVSQLQSFDSVYNDLSVWFTDRDYSLPWNPDAKSQLETILKQSISISRKYDCIKKELYGGKKPTKSESDVIDPELFLKLLCGSKVSTEALFSNDQYDEIGSFSLANDDEQLAELMSKLSDDDALLLQKAKSVYDWTLLINVLHGAPTISEAKVGVYMQHKSDLQWLKQFIRTYSPQNYASLFRNPNAKDNYSAFITSAGNAEGFFKNLSRILKGIEPENDDLNALNDAKERIVSGTFLPKQVNTDNRVIPYQLYWVELDAILKNAVSYLPFLAQKDADDISVSDKIRSIFEFRVPYYVGPLNMHSNHAWLKRKTEGKIYPWNLSDRVDLDASEEEFIRRMTAKCTYLPWEDVLPKDSLLYHRFTVLNEINNIKVDDVPITTELKQELYNALFLYNRKLSKSKIEDYLKAHGHIGKESKVSGIDGQINSNLRPQQDFVNLFESKQLSEEDAEAIILRITCTDDKLRLKKWLRNRYGFLSEKDRNDLAKLNYKDFGRLSKAFLTELHGVNRGTGEVMTIMQALWETNYNLMELLSDKFTFTEEIQKELQLHYDSQPLNIAERLDTMYISNAVKRPIIRTLDMVQEIVHARGSAPDKIFIEMARGASDEQKNKRTESRLQQILSLYEKCKDEDVQELKQQLDNMGESANTKLQAKALFLYYMQLGKCLYTGKSIDLTKLSEDYNIDHIYPRSQVKDDSISNNMVLVDSNANGEKTDIYPIDPNIQKEMRLFWEMLLKNGMISAEKFKRLTRTTPFSADEKWGFINRQMTETTQSTKAVASILQELYPETEIVYVKARLATEFRQTFDCLKSRTFNDLHHAKDAYLNIVTGNVYHSKFTKTWFYKDPNQEYNVKPEIIYTRPFKRGNEVIWAGTPMLEKVKKIVHTQHAHMTRYAFCRKGGFFDQQPVAKAEGLIPLKKNLPTEKYGGYNKPTVSFFLLVKYSVGKKTELMMVPVQLLYCQDVMASEQNATEYAKKRIGEIINKKVDMVSFPLGLRKIKINTILSLDGFRVCISGSASKGRCIIAQPFMPFIAGQEWNQYVKRIESICEKTKNNPKYIIDEEKDKITTKQNAELYELYIDKLSNSVFKKRPNNPVDTLKQGKKVFLNLALEKQTEALLHIHDVFGRVSNGCDLTLIGGKEKAAATCSFSSSVSNWAKYYSDVRLIDSSAAGLYEKTSPNLLSFL